MSVLLVLTGCTQNLISGFVNPNSDAALYQDALDQINNTNWTKAITDIQSMSTSGQSQRTTMFTFATALAGQCGFQLASFFEGLATAWGTGTTPEQIPLTLMQAFQNTTINMLVPGVTTPVATTDTYCSWAQQVMDNIQTNYGPWNSNEQTFVVFYALGRIGINLKYTAGAGATLSSGLLIPDTTFEACNHAGTGVLTDFYATQISTGLALFLKYYTIISFLSSLTVGSTTLPTYLCGGSPLSMTFCNDLTPTAVAASAGADLKNVRGILTSSTSTPLVILSVLDKAYPTSQQNDTTPSVPAGIWQCTDIGITATNLNCCL